VRDDNERDPEERFSVDAYFRKYDRVYRPVANAEATAEKAVRDAARKSANVKRGGR